MSAEKQTGYGHSQTTIMYPYQTLSTHTHEKPLSISPISHTVFSPSKYTFSKFSLPLLTLDGNGPDLGKLSLNKDNPPQITMMKVVEKKRDEIIAYVACGNILYIVKGDIILRKIVVREEIVSFCWIGSLICILGKSHVTMIDEAQAKLYQEDVVKQKNGSAVVKMEQDIKSEDSESESASTDDSSGDSDAMKSESDDDSDMSDEDETMEISEVVSKLTDVDNHFTPYVSRVQLPHDTTPVNIFHFPTYLNKVFIISSEGHIDLFNVVHGVLVYRYGPFQRSEGDDIDRNTFLMRERRQANRTEFATITHFEPVPETLDIAAIGLSDGKVLLHDMYTDETLETFRHGVKPIRSISFRTDGEPIMVTGSDNGSIVVWDLLAGKLVTTYKSPHMGSVISLDFLKGMPLLVSSSSDNCIKLWEFTSPEKMMFKASAEGHSKPPSKLRFYGPTGSWVLSAGHDRQVRITNIHTGFSNSFNHKLTTVERKGVDKVFGDKAISYRPPVLDFDFNFMREREWSNLVTTHRKSNSITCWKVKGNYMDKVLTPVRANKYFDAEGSCVGITPCGNSIILGRKSGSLERWNLQSGKLKGRYFTGPADKRFSAHSGPVNGVVVDNLNMYVFSGGFDGMLRVWKVKEDACFKEINMGQPIFKIAKSKSANMIAIAFADSSITLMDAESFTVMRSFKGHTSSINDMCFSNDSRFMFTCANDGYIIVWDIISGEKVEWIEVRMPATSIDIDNKDMYIVTSHSKSVGLSVWINKITLGIGSLKYVSAPVRVSLPLLGDSFHKEVDYEVIPDDSEEKKITPEEYASIVDDMQRTSGADFIQQLGEEGEQKVLAVRKLDTLRERAKLFKTKDFTALREEMPFFIETEADQFFDTKFVIDDSLVKKNDTKFESEDIMRDIQPVQPDYEEGSRISTKRADPPSSRLIDMIIRANEAANEYYPEPPAADHEGEEVTEQDNARPRKGSVSANYKYGEEEEEDAINVDSDAKHSNELLGLSKQDNDVLEYIKQASPKIIDMSIRVISALNEGREIVHFLKFLLRAFASKKCFDILQSMFNLFLRTHDETIIASENISIYRELYKLSQIELSNWGKLEELISKNLFLCKHLSNLQ